MSKHIYFFCYCPKNINRSICLLEGTLGVFLILARNLNEAMSNNIY